MPRLHRPSIRLAAALALLALLLSDRAGAQDPARANVVENVFVVTLDGFRWQETVRRLRRRAQHQGGRRRRRARAAPAQRFDRPTPEARREALLPFLWTVVAREGQILGDPASGSRVRVTNGLWFSYPGYNEMLSGFADPRVDSNDKKPNPNVTVLEWLNGRPGFEGRVAAFGTWDVLPFIVAAERSGAARQRRRARGARARERPRPAAERLHRRPAGLLGAATRFDAPTMQGALEYLRTRQPRVLYVMLGETDEWAHGRRYDLYLDAAWRSDRFVRRLWEDAQSLPAYRGRTALVLATDHGRGATPARLDRPRPEGARRRARSGWRSSGPDTPALGVREGVQATQSQLAATVAALLGLGEDFRTAPPKAAPPLPDLVR